MEGGGEQSHDEEVLLDDGLEDVGEQVLVQGQLVSVFEGMFRIKRPTSKFN